MKYIKKFNEIKKEEKTEDQKILFSADSLIDENEPSIKTKSEEDNEKVQKDFKNSMDKIEKFESFIDIHIDNIENFEQEEDSEPVGCGCCQDCTGQNDCECCQDCTCDEEKVQEINPEKDVKVMNMFDFIKSIDGQ